MNDSGMQLWLPGASSVAPRVDGLLLYLLLTTGFLTLAVAVLIITFTIKYRRRSPQQIGEDVTSRKLEWTWTGATAALFLTMFLWSAYVFMDVKTPPPDAVQIYIVGKQWMWISEYPNGHREINQLHVPVGQPVRITLTSQDVIHSFFIPAFRIKQDAIPGRYTTEWFTATQPGKYHLFCAEFCGAKHSGMIGWIYAIAPAEFQSWLTSGAPEGSMASNGEKLFHQFGCANCHNSDGHGPGPRLLGIYGTQVRVTDQPDVTADEAYLRESILNPTAKIAYGFASIMPNFQGQLTETQVLELIEYIRSMGLRDPAPSSSGSLPQDTGTRRSIVAPGSTSATNSSPDDR